MNKDERRADRMRLLADSVAQDPVRAHRRLGNFLLTTFFTGVVIGVGLTIICAAIGLLVRGSPE